MIEAIILAGGMGTRLQNTITDMPKPMAPVKGKPFLFYLFHWLRKYPIDKIILSVGYKSENIIEYFGRSFGCIPLDYAVEEEPLGTGGAILNSLKITGGCDILIMNGDTWFPININKFVAFHTENKSVFSVALKKLKDFSRYGSVELRGDTIIRFNEKKKCKEGLINGGIYLVSRSFFESRQYPKVFSLEEDVLIREAGTSVLKGIVFDDLFIDIGIPEDYRRAGSVIGYE
jgi:D-glycero-alpha-D-manno-heptose 1-phosphate guanylyltransferase